MNDKQLALYRNRIIEECARVVESFSRFVVGADEIAAAIRARKDQ